MLEYQLEVPEMDKTNPRTHLELKQWVENELNKVIPENIWEYLIQQNTVDETLHKVRKKDDYLAQIALESFVANVRDLLNIIRDAQKSRSQQSMQDENKGSEDELTDREIERAQALAEYHAKFASADRKIRDFRDSVLQGDLLSPEKADAFVTSVTICFADRFDFRSYNISYKDHMATLIEDETYSEQGKFYQKISFTVEPSRTELEQPFTVRFPIKDRMILDWVNADYSFQQIMYRKHSLLDELITLSDTLAQRIGCYQQVAALFILTGNPPSIRPISVEGDTSRRFGTYSFHKGTITMKIQPWVSPDSVLRTYRKLQQHEFGHSYRPTPSSRQLELFRFITQELTITRNSNPTWDDIVERPKWRELFERWNRSHPDDQYTQLSILERDYARAEKSILLPPYIALR